SRCGTGWSCWTKRSCRSSSRLRGNDGGLRYHSAMLAKPRILVVEDESAIADTIVYVLAGDGFAPQWCATAEQALAAFGQERPALAILDVGLPDLNGFQLFRRLRALPGGDAVPMLFLTARSD